VRQVEDAQAEQLMCSSCSGGWEAPNGRGRPKCLAAGMLYDCQRQL